MKRKNVMHFVPYIYTLRNVDGKEGDSDSYISEFKHFMLPKRVM